MTEPDDPAGWRLGAGELRLVGWNVRDLTGDPLAVHRVLRGLEPDIACLQEMPRRPGGGLRARLVARGTGLRHVAGGRSSGGTAVFAGPRVAITQVSTLRLPVAGLLTRRRGAVVVDVSIPGGIALTVACVHLPLTAAERLDHVARVCAVLAARGGPAGALAVAVDVNEQAGGPAWRAWEPWVRDVTPTAGPTFPARSPSARIDAVLVGDGLSVVAFDDLGKPSPEHGVRSADVRRASDHLPVLVTLRGRAGA